MNEWGEEVQSHFDLFLSRVGVSENPGWYRDENAQYCRGMVATAVISLNITIDQARDMHRQIDAARERP